MVRWGRILALVLVLLVVPTGCNPITIRSARMPDLFDSARESLASNCQLSPRSLQTLRRLDLTESYAHDPQEAARRLHQLENPALDLVDRRRLARNGGYAGGLAGGIGHRGRTHLGAVDLGLDQLLDRVHDLERDRRVTRWR